MMTAAPELKAAELVEDCYTAMLYGCAKLLVSECKGTDEYTWKIPYTAADNTAAEMVTNTAADSVIVATLANPGDFKYYKVVGVDNLCEETKTSNVKEGNALWMTKIRGRNCPDSVETVKAHYCDTG